MSNTITGENINSILGHGPATWNRIIEIINIEQKKETRMEWKEI